jgi:hypothetical protein
MRPKARTRAPSSASSPSLGGPLRADEYEVAASDRRRCRGLVQCLSPGCRLVVQLFKQVEPETIDLLHCLEVRRWVFAERPSVLVSIAAGWTLLPASIVVGLNSVMSDDRVGVCWLLKFVGEVDALSWLLDKHKRDLSNHAIQNRPGVNRALKRS